MKFHGFYTKAIRVAAKLLKDPAKVMALIRQANRKTYQAGKHKSAIDKQVPNWQARVALLGRMVKAYVQGRYQPRSNGLMVKAVAALLYFVWLFDLVPDMIPIAGLVDDATVLAWLFSSFKAELNHFEEWERTHDPS